MEDGQIIELFWSRTERAIEELAAKYGRLCQGIAYRILESRPDAEECESDTYLRVWNTVPPGRPASLCAYVSRIVRNLALDRLRHRNRWKRSAQYEVLLSELDQCIPALTDVEKAADDTAAQAIAAFLNTLDSRTRILFVRRYFYVESIETLAKRYGMNASSISTRLVRVRKKLRAFLEREGVAI